jgi:hypothetical protein
LSIDLRAGLGAHAADLGREPAERAHIVRVLADKIRKGRYHPRPLREHVVGDRIVFEAAPTDAAVHRALLDLQLRPAVARMLDPLCGGGVLPGTSPGHVVRSVAAARVVHPHAHILRADVENFYDSIAWQVALSAAAQAGVDSAVLDLLRVFAEAWRGSLRQGVPTSPALAALVVADANRVLRANSVMSACWADDVVAVTLMPGVALGSLEIALASVGLKLNATKSRVLTPLRTVEILGFEITASGSILPGRRALLRLLRDVLNLPSTDRQKRLAAALPYWWLTASAGFSRFDLLHRAVDSQATRPFSSAAVRTLSQIGAVDIGGLLAPAGRPLCEGTSAATEAQVFPGNTPADQEGSAPGAGRGISANRRGST